MVTGLSGEEAAIIIRQHSQIVELLEAEQNFNGSHGLTLCPTRGCACGYCGIARILGLQENERPAEAETPTNG